MAKEILQDDGGNNISEQVDVIASGYEWVCPACSKLNNEIEVKQTVICRDCKRAFSTRPPEHAYA